MSCFRFVICCLLLCCFPVSVFGGNSPVVINEVFYQDTGSDDWIEYKNISDSQVDISTWWTCRSTICVQLQVVLQLFGDDLILEPGEIVVVDTAFFASETAGEITLQDPNFTIMDHMQYGSDSNFGHADDAALANLWLEIDSESYDFIPTSESDESASWCGTQSGGGALTLSLDFENSPPTLGTDNFCQPFFADGFESGDFSGWSTAVGGS